MATQLGNWAIGLGGIVLFIGLCVLPAAFGTNPDPALIPVGACLFSLGAILIAAGIYVKARSIQALNTAAAVVQSPAALRKNRGGCDLCGTEAPAVFCKIHQLHLCGSCLTQHYDLRSCIYVPTSRRPVNKLVNKPVKESQAKAHGA